MAFIPPGAFARSACNLYVLPLSEVPSGRSGFLPQSRDMQVRLIVVSQLPVGVNGCFSPNVSQSDELATYPWCT